MTRNHQTRGIVAVAGVMVVMLAIAASAFASGNMPLISSHATPGLQPMIFGAPGAQPVLAPNCARKQMWITPAGKTWAGAQPNGKSYVFAISTVTGAQIKCLIHRVDAKTVTPPDTCFVQAGPVPATAEAPADKQGYHDTQGLNALRAWVSKLASCEAAR